MPPEQLFVERCLQFLKPGGRMAIVLPDSILSNPGLAFIRRWLFHNAYVLASIDLPREAFARSDTHTMTSILVLQKFTRQERGLVRTLGRTPDYLIFMAVADKVGWDLRGYPIYRRTPSGEIILGADTSEPVVDDRLPDIVSAFSKWLGERSLKGFLDE